MVWRSPAGRRVPARRGLPSVAAATGRTDMLEQVRWDAGLQLKPMLAAAAIVAEKGGPVRWEGQRNDRPEAHKPIDDAWVEPAPCIACPPSRTGSYQ